MSEPRVLGICGSLRPDSFTRVTLQLALAEAKAEGARVTLFDPAETPLPFCQDCSPADELAANAERLRALAAEADGFLLATPEYHGSFSGVLKNALDLLSAEQFEGKVCGLLSVLGGQSNSNALNHLRLVCRQIHAWVIPHQAAVGHSYQSFNGDRITDEKAAARVARVGRDVAQFARLLRDARQAVQ